MCLNKIFDHIYCINLKRRYDRRILCEHKLNKMNIVFQFVDAVDGYDTKYDILCNKILNKDGTWIKSRGAIGLILTYIQLLEDAMIHKYNNILILEDDINFHKNFDKELERTKKNINFNEIDCIWLGANQYRFDEKQKAQIEDPNCDYYTISRLKWYYTFGTYAIGMNKHFIIELRKTLDLNEIIYGIDVHIFWALANLRLNGRILKPFLILPDVTDSDNMGIRDQEEFMLNRMYKIEDYTYISISDIQSFKKILNTYRISLRHLFCKFTTSLLISYNQWIDGFKAIKSIDSENINTLIKIADNIYKYYVSDNMLCLNDVFKSIDEKNNFVFIVPSYNNIDNYKLNLDSIKNQIYPGYQMRIIYINDSSDDGTSDAVIKFIKDNLLENCVTYITMNMCANKRQRQGMARFLGYHKSFDDEICINLDGDDWLYDEFVLDTLDTFYKSHDIMVTYGSYYVYDSHNTSEGKHMGMTYNNKLINIRQYPDTIKNNRLFKTYDWIAGHLRTGYALLFKSIELRHFMGPDGFFFRMGSDQGEMFPVLEMAGSKHLNIMKPMLIYNKHNSLQFDTSYYKMHEESNKESKIYREQITQLIKSRPVYPLVNKSELLLNSKFESMYINYNVFDNPIIDILKILHNIKTPYIYVGNKNIDTLKEFNDILQVIRSKPGIILSDPINIELHEGAIIYLSDKVNYAVRKIIDLANNFKQNIDMMEFIHHNHGIYDREKLIRLLMNDRTLDNEIVLIPLI